MRLRPYAPGDREALWHMLEPAIRAGDVYALPRDMTEAEAIAHWAGADRQTFVADDDGLIVGSYYIRANQLGGGSHVANGGYVTALEARGRGVARAMGLASLDQARERGFKAMQFNFVIATNAAAVHLWTSLGFDTIARLPLAFDHPDFGYCDALVMHRTL